MTDEPGTVPRMTPPAASEPTDRAWLLQQRSVLTRLDDADVPDIEGGQRFEGGHRWYAAENDDDPEVLRTVLALPADVVDGLGDAQTITVTVRPGDELNVGAEDEGRYRAPVEHVRAGQDDDGPDVAIVWSRVEGEQLTVANVIAQAMGVASVAWSHPEGSGVFDDDLAVRAIEAVLRVLPCRPDDPITVQPPAVNADGAE